MPDEIRPASWQDLITAEAKKQRVDPRLALAVAETESSFNPAAKSPKGALGLFQLMPETAARRGVDPLDPVQNIRGGIGELRGLLDAHQNDVVMALRRYNGSPQASEAVTQPYVDKVLGKLRPEASVQPGAPPPAAPGLTAPTMAVSRTQPTQPGEDIAEPPPAPPEGWSDWALRHGKGMLSSFDPGTPEGRRNIGGAIGAAIGGTLAAPTAAVSGPIGPATGAVGGAMAAGALVSGGERLIQHFTGGGQLNRPLFPWAQTPPSEPVGTPPPTMGQVAQAAAAGGIEQGIYQMGGHAIMWPIKAGGRQVIGTRVGRYAAEGLSQAKEATLTRLQGALDAAQTTLRGTRRAVTQATAGQEAVSRRLVSTAAQEARAGVQAAAGMGEERVAGAKGRAAQGVSEAEQAAAAAEVAARAPYEHLVGAPPPTRAAGRQVQEVLKGPAAEARDIAGKKVRATAASGPEVDITPLKAEAQRIVERQIRPPAETFPRRTTAELSNEEITAQSGIAPDQLAKMREATPGSRNAQNLADLQAAVASAQGEAAKETLKHPAMGVLQRILNAEDTVPFLDTHLWKEELSNAIRGTRDQAVRSQVASLTQHLTGELRNVLRQAGHAPYEAATAAYGKLAPAYTEGIAKQLKRLSRSDPEAVVRLLRQSNPTQAELMHDLLTTYATEGGGEAEGRAALEAVQSAWVHQNLILGGIEKLGDRLAKLKPEFREAFLPDPKATQVLDNLKLISTAYKTAVQQGERGIEAATVAGKGRVEAVGELAAQRTAAAREAGQQGMEAVRASRASMMAQVRQAGAQVVEQAEGQIPPAKRALAAGKRQTAGEAAEFAQSSLGRRLKPGAGQQFARDALLALALGPQRFYGAISLSRVLHGPTASDLVRWASYSPRGTRLFVKAVTSNRPAEALANLARTSGILGSTTNRFTGQEPPEPATPGPVGIPPPGRVAAQSSAVR